MIATPCRPQRGHPPLVLLLVSVALAIVGAIAPIRIQDRPAQHVAGAAAAASADAGGNARDVAVLRELHGHASTTELSTRAPRLAAIEAPTRPEGSHRDVAGGAASLHLQQNFRTELNYRMLLLRGRSGAEAGYTSTPPPSVLH
jgi:hypothetical protein